VSYMFFIYFFFQADDGIRYFHVTGVQTCALPISRGTAEGRARRAGALLRRRGACGRRVGEAAGEGCRRAVGVAVGVEDLCGCERSEERRVGKGGGGR